MNYNSGKLKQQLKQHEGLRLKSYTDSVGVLTIGYGHNLEAMTITETQADNWLKEDIETAAEELEAAYPFVNVLTEKRQRVLINMSFNLGITRLSRFKKMWKALEKGDYYTSANEMEDSKWFKQVGTRAEELVTMMRVG